MNNFFMNHQELVWPLILFLAWIFGEVGRSLTKIPKVSFYVFFGFIFSKYQLGILPELNSSKIVFLVNIIAGLVLFEFGYHINLRWLKNNPLIIITSIVESMLTFIVIFIIAKSFDCKTEAALEFGAIFMATSPLLVMYITNQEQSSGQVTERVLHLTALSCVFALFTLRFILGLLIFQKFGSLWHAAWAGIVMVALSILLGIVAALFLSHILKLIPAISNDRTVSFSLMIIVVVAIAKALLLSPTIATLVFGIVSRHNKIAMGKTQRNFGALGDLLVVALFVVVPLNLNWHNMTILPILAITLCIGRLITKVVVVAIFSRIDGISWTKGVLTGLALTPMAVFSMLLLDQTESIVYTIDQDLQVVSILILIWDLVSPSIVQYSLHKAKESIWK